MSGGPGFNDLPFIPPSYQNGESDFGSSNG